VARGEAPWPGTAPGPPKRFKDQNANPSVRRTGDAQTGQAYASRNTPRKGPTFADERSEFGSARTSEVNTLASRGLLHDRSNYSGDFNGPRGTFSMTTHGYAESDRWEGMSHADKSARKEVHDFYRNQKQTSTWNEANRLAKNRTNAQFRTAQRTQGDTSHLNANHYAESYQANLVRVMAVKGKGIAEAAGELKPRHPQSGYGRT